VPISGLQTAAVFSATKTLTAETRSVPLAASIRVVGPFVVRTRFLLGLSLVLSVPIRSPVGPHPSPTLAAHPHPQPDNRGDQDDARSTSPGRPRTEEAKFIHRFTLIVNESSMRLR
jgi:hypothetical protein